MFVLQFNGTMPGWSFGRQGFAHAARILLALAWIFGAVLIHLTDPPWVAGVAAALLLLSFPARRLTLRTWTRGSLDWLGPPRT
jgi:hypothetical protein